MQNELEIMMLKTNLKYLKLKKQLAASLVAASITSIICSVATLVCLMLNLKTEAIITLEILTGGFILLCLIGEFIYWLINLNHKKALARLKIENRREQNDKS